MGYTQNNPEPVLASCVGTLDELTRPRKSQILLDLFWAGFLIYTMGFVVSQTNYFNWKLCQLFQILGLVLLLFGGFFQIRFRLDNAYLRTLLVLYIIWLTGVVIRGFHLDYDLIKGMLFDARFGVFLYFVPGILLFEKDLFFYKRLFDVIFVFGIAFLILNVLFFREILFADPGNLTSTGMVEMFARTLGVPSSFVLLTFFYHSKKQKVISFSVILIIVILAILKARRGLLVIAALPFFFYYVFYLLKSQSKALLIFFSMALCSLFLVYGKSIYEETRLLGNLKERGLENTRITVENCFYQDMTTKDWIIGKGLNGRYFCPDIDPDEKTGYRDMIETDYLQIILKGGIVSLGLLLLIALPGAFLGLFRSENLLSKAAGAWILLALINMYPSTVNTFMLNYLLVWISIGICYSRTIRTMPDSLFKLYFSPRSRNVR